MSHPRIEEVSDDDDSLVADDPEEMDLDAFDFARPQKGILASAQAPTDPDVSSMTPQALQALLAGQDPGLSSTPQPQTNERDRDRFAREQHEKSKHFQCIYPIYFDAARSREDGRRVSKADAVANPLARTLVDALQNVGEKHHVPLQIFFEPTKTHPRDWANPGRVRVLIKEDGKKVSSKIHNKHHLYKLISAYLHSHPTTADAPMRFRIQGMPMPKDGKIPPPAIPRGSKISSILPLHSPALSGGGVSDNFLQDMMADMGGQLPPGVSPEMLSAMGGGAGAAGGGGGAPKKVKEKKKK